MKTCQDISFANELRFWTIHEERFNELVHSDIVKEKKDYFIIKGVWKYFRYLHP